jgi:glucose/arabinose dehydrogenase
MKTLLMLPLASLLAAGAYAQDAGTLYQKNCSHCHGANFQGGNAQSLVDGVWQFGDGTGYITRNIKFGITHLGMPAYEKTLTDKQIKSLVTYLRDAEKKEGAVKPPIPEHLQTLDYELDVEILAEGLEIPWNLAFLDKNFALVTERPGRLRVIKNGRLLPDPVEGIPGVAAEGQGGLLAVAFDPDYHEKGNQWIYLAFSHGIKKASPGDKRVPAMTKVVRGRLEGNTWKDERVVFEARHDTYRTARVHFGARIVFDAQKNLYFSIGDRGAGEHAQDLSKPNGKVHRVHPDGSIPKDNPFRGNPGALPSIFSYGHRNPQGLSFHPASDTLWSAEHGPMGGDEINRLEAGKNYGWPIITYGRNYNGTPVTDLVRKDGMEQPVWYWNPSTAVCGIGFYSGDLFPKWNNKLLVGALKYEDVRILDIENNRVMHEEVILKNAGRVRDVVCGPDGAIYVVLNSPGTILRLTPDV